MPRSLEYRRYKPTLALPSDFSYVQRNMFAGKEMKTSADPPIRGDTDT